jgi:predicted nucleic acid-binding protein
MIVVDAAVVVDLLTQAPGADRIGQRLVGEDLHAPHLIDIEVVSALRGLVLGGRISESRAMDALTDHGDLPITRWGSTDHHRRASLGLRDNVTAYDAAYLVLANELECPLLTRDGRLGRGLSVGVGVEVI